MTSTKLLQNVALEDTRRQKIYRNRTKSGRKIRPQPQSDTNRNSHF